MKYALVTGTDHGVGLELARELLQREFFVVACRMNPEEKQVDAIKDMDGSGRRVTVIDTENLSTGMGHMIIKAVEMRDSGCSTAEIVLRPKLFRRRKI